MPSWSLARQAIDRAVKIHAAPFRETGSDRLAEMRRYNDRLAAAPGSPPTPHEGGRLMLCRCGQRDADEQAENRTPMNAAAARRAAMLRQSSPQRAAASGLQSWPGRLKVQMR